MSRQICLFYIHVKWFDMLLLMLQETQETLVYVVLTVELEHPEQLDCLELLVALASLEVLGLQAVVDPQDPLVLLGPLGIEVLPESRVSLVQSVHLGQLVGQVTLATPVKQDFQEQWEEQVLLEKLDHLVHLELLVLQVTSCDVTDVNLSYH